MVSGSNFTIAYPRSASRRHFAGEPRETRPAQKREGLIVVEIARMEKEMESLERDFRIFQDQFGQNTLHFGAAQRYVRKLLENGKVKKFLQQRHTELLEILLEVAALDAV
jgi:hypothetical protein